MRARALTTAGLVAAAIVMSVSGSTAAGVSALAPAALPGQLPNWSPSIVRSVRDVASTKPVLKIWIVGDSIAYCWGSKQYAGEAECFSRFLDKMLPPDQPYELRVDAEPGAPASYWTPRIDGILASYTPDLAIFALGTNNHCETATGRAAFKSDLSTLYDKALHSHLWYAKIAPVFITYSRLSPSHWITQSEPSCNDATFEAQYQYAQNGLVAGYVSIDHIPTSLLQADGIHYSEAANEAFTEIVVNGVADTYGWPHVPTTCGLDGHRPGGEPAAYVNCEATP